MSWVLAMLAAAVALFFLVRARNQAAKRFHDVLEARAREEARRAKLDRNA